MTRRALLSLLLAAVLLASCGCSAILQQAGEEQTPEEDQDAAITLSTQSTEDLFYLPYTAAMGVNPYTCESQVNRVFLPLLYDGLFAVTPDYKAEGRLCASWTVSNGQTAYLLTLREGVRFQSGAALTAEDVVYSLNYAREHGIYQNRLSCITSVSLSGGGVLIQLDQARDQFPLLLDVPIVRQGTAEANVPDGTGPYLPCQDAADVYLSARSDWWSTETLPTTRIYLLECSTAAQVRDSFEYGRISLACTDVNGSATAVYHSDCEQWTLPTSIMLYLGFNMDKGLFAQKAVRQAVTYAIDRQTIAVDCCGGYAYPASLPASPLSPAYDAGLAARYQLDADKAAQMLRDAGLADRDRNGTLDYESQGGYLNAEATLIVRSDNLSALNAANAIARALRTQGLSIQVDALSQDSFRSRLQSGDYDLYFDEIRLTADFDLTALLEKLELDDAYIRTLCNLALENVGNYYDLHAYLMDEGVLCPVAFKSLAVYTGRGSITGLSLAPDNVFYNLGGIALVRDSG